VIAAAGKVAGIVGKRDMLKAVARQNE
jgi:hypothetical protein